MRDGLELGISFALTLALATCALTGCPGTPPASAPSAAPSPSTGGSATGPATGGPSTGGPATLADARRQLAWTTPQGWSSKSDPSGVRTASFAPASHASVDVSIAVLPGGVANLGPNVNRWRTQMGLPEVPPEAIAQLPSQPMLGGQGVLVELEGAYSGMGGAAQPGSKLVGAIYPLPSGAGSIFVKAVGPAAAIDAEKPAFLALVSSLRFGSPRVEATAPANQQALVALEWTAPPGWTEAPARPMRIVTLLAQQKTECWVTILPGQAGGVAANLNRWRQQMGASELTPQGLKALPKVKVLGEDTPLVEATGDYSDMQGTKHPQYTLLGVACPQKERTVFVKMVGPADEVRAERERFVAFLASLR